MVLECFTVLTDYPGFRIFKVQATDENCAVLQKRIKIKVNDSQFNPFSEFYTTVSSPWSGSAFGPMSHPSTT